MRWAVLERFDEDAWKLAGLIVATIGGLVALIARVSAFGDWLAERHIRAFAQMLARAMKHPRHGPDLVRPALVHLFPEEIAAAARREEKIAEHEEALGEIREVVDGMQGVWSERLAEALESIQRSGEATTSALREIRDESRAEMRRMREEQAERDRQHAERVQHLGDQLHELSGIVKATITTRDYEGPDRRRHPR